MFIFIMTALSHGSGQDLQSPVFEMFFLPISLGKSEINIHHPYEGLKGNEWFLGF